MMSRSSSIEATGFPSAATITSPPMRKLSPAITACWLPAFNPAPAAPEPAVTVWITSPFLTGSANERAMSVEGSLPTSVAFSVSSFENRTSIEVAPSTTWKFVAMCPCLSSTKPDPSAELEGPIVAVDVTQRFRARAADEHSLTGLGETLTRALLLGSADIDRLARAHADLVIAPADDGVGMLEFHQLDRVRLAGRRAAVAALEADSSWLPR